MKKAVAIVFAVMCFCSSASLALAQDQNPAQNKDASGKDMAGDKMHKGMMGKGMMMPMMMAKQMVASNDGGVIVLAGNKLYKYDKNLTLVKEAEVKVDKEAMEKMMADMKAKCPMMKHDEKAEKPGDPEEPGSDKDMDDMPMPAK